MKSIERWLEQYFKKCISSGKLSKRCNNYELYKDVMDTYNEFITSADHDWLEDIYFIPILDVMSRYVYREIEPKQCRLIKWFYSKIYFTKNSPWFGNYYDRHIKRYVKASISKRHTKPFDKKYRKYINELYD